CGFEPFERDDGLHLDDGGYFELRYNDYLREHGYEGGNPWHTAANSAWGRGRKLRSGWLMRNAKYPAIVAEEHSETAYMTNRAMDFMREAGDSPWCLHLSYIKPHWPYMAPAPYHDMYGADDVIAANRNKSEKRDPHPVFGAYMDHIEGRTFSREKVRQTVIPAYMGLIRQIDDHLKRLFAFMNKQKLLDNTLIVFTSDHGDFLGDHWLGEKELFFDAAARIPLIVADPDPAADKTRGKKCADLVEAIDLLPTFIEAYGGIVPGHILEGRSLLTYIRGGKSPGREAAVSELDYCFRPAREKLRVAPDKARAWMVRSRRWKYIRYEGFAPQLYDLENDPMELEDRGRDPGLEKIRREHEDRLAEWSLNRKVRVTLPNDVVLRVPTEWRDQGILIGEW
ncbi:MAG TPA: sulfatase-like hydrolase/transferase, partial [Rhizomicrobium sp.]|nr:sulfatase-like hydrolase/transferase [Rhizomicrobium sp.]